MIGHGVGLRLVVAVLSLDLVIILVVDDPSLRAGKVQLLHQLVIERLRRSVQLVQQLVVALIRRVPDSFGQAVPIGLALGLELVEPLVVLVLALVDEVAKLAAQLLQGRFLLQLPDAELRTIAADFVHKYVGLPVVFTAQLHQLDGFPSVAALLLDNDLDAAGTILFLQVDLPVLFDGDGGEGVGEDDRVGYRPVGGGDVFLSGLPDPALECHGPVGFRGSEDQHLPLRFVIDAVFAGALYFLEGIQIESVLVDQEFRLRLAGARDAQIRLQRGGECELGLLFRNLRLHMEGEDLVFVVRCSLHHLFDGDGNIARQLVGDVAGPGAGVLIERGLAVDRGVAGHMALQHGVAQRVPVLVLAGKVFGLERAVAVYGHRDGFDVLLLAVDHRKLHALGAQVFLALIAFPGDRAGDVHIIRADPGIRDGVVDIIGRLIRLDHTGSVAVYGLFPYGINVFFGPVVLIIIKAGEVFAVRILGDDRRAPAAALAGQRRFGDLFVIAEDLNEYLLGIFGRCIHVLPFLGDMELQVIAIEQIAHGKVVDEIAPSVWAGVGVRLVIKGNVSVNVGHLEDVFRDILYLTFQLFGVSIPPVTPAAQRKAPYGRKSHLFLYVDRDFVYIFRPLFENSLHLDSHMIEKDEII